MIDVSHGYLTAGLLYLGIWTLLFAVSEPFVRVVMLVGGVLFCGLGPLGQQLWFLHDWWHPPGAFTAQPWPEDILLIFAHIGIVVAIYPALVRRRSGRRPHSTSMRDCARALMRMVPFLLLSLLVVWGVWALQVHSSVACAAGMLAGGSYLLWRRPDLWPEALVSGALMVAVTLPVFWLLAWLSPHWVDQSWQPGLYSRWRLLGMPLGDMAFYACSGFQCGPLLAFMFDFRWQPLQRRMTVHQ